jgi:hypothetical protein
METVLNTNGQGLWSQEARAVKVTGLSVPYVNDEQDFGELRVYFDTRTWNVNSEGLIYTDGQFLKELREFLTSRGLAAGDVSYSEAGMQGDDYVSLDVGAQFLQSWQAHAGVDSPAA